MMCYFRQLEVLEQQVPSWSQLLPRLVSKAEYYSATFRHL